MHEFFTSEGAYPGPIFRRDRDHAPSIPSGGTKTCLEADGRGGGLSGITGNLATYLPVVALAVFGLSIPIWLQLFGGVGEAGQQILLVFSPIRSASDVLLASASVGAPIADFGRLPFAVALVSEGPESVEKAYSAGALLVIKSPLSLLCGS